MQALNTPTSQTRPQCPAVVVEWKGEPSGDARRAAGLASLCQQLWRIRAGTQGIPEVVIVFDRQKHADSVIRSLVAKAGGTRGWPGNIIIAAAPVDTDCYAHRNFGFSLTRNATVVFLDSDLVPEEGWLERTLTDL